MAITKKSARQSPIVARVVVTLGTGADIGVQGTYAAIDVPANAIVIGGHINVSDASTATVDIHVGDGVNDNRYADNIDGGATGLTALTITGYKYTTADTIDIMVDTADPAAAGQFELVVMYIVDGRAEFAQG